MKKLQGSAAFFLNARTQKAMNEWYIDHLGLASADDGGILFEWRDLVHPDKKGYTVLAPFKETTKYFEPSQKEFMINLRVENLEALLEKLKKRKESQ